MGGGMYPTTVTSVDATTANSNDPQDSFYGGAIQKYPSDLYHTNHLVASVNQKS